MERSAGTLIVLLSCARLNDTPATKRKSAELIMRWEPALMEFVVHLFMNNHPHPILIFTPLRSTQVEIQQRPHLMVDSQKRPHPPLLRRRPWMTTSRQLCLG
jgi:hypothetical protein